MNLIVYAGLSRCIFELEICTLRLQTFLKTAIFLERSDPSSISPLAINTRLIRHCPFQTSDNQKYNTTSCIVNSKRIIHNSGSSRWFFFFFLACYQYYPDRNEIHYVNTRFLYVHPAMWSSEKLRLAVCTHTHRLRSVRIIFYYRIICWVIFISIAKSR